VTTPSTVDEALAEASTKMAKAVAVFKEDLAAIRTGRASPGLVQKLEVDYYGAQVPLNQLASFSVPEPRLLVIQPFDRNAIAAIEKAILGSDLGITPSNDGQVIRLAFPPLTEERRKELIKLVHHRAEEARIAVRNVRRHDKEALERLEREGAISEDELRRAEKELQKLTDQHVAEIDEIQRHKEQELREIA
jgi:ribosome recycling factor